MKYMDRVTNGWLTRGNAVKIIQEPAVRLAQVTPHSCTVERVCKAHSLIHTKARNRLHLKVVKMLLYCYVNLRMINKCEAELGEFLVEALEEVEEEESAAAADDGAAAA